MNRNRDMLMPLSYKFHCYFRYHRMMIMRIKRAQREIKNQKMLEQLKLKYEKNPDLLAKKVNIVQIFNLKEI